jgi:hypothetical protein
VPQLRRIGLVLLAAGLTVPAFATPKRLDLKKLLAQPPPKRQQYVPARAGWDGPEFSPKSGAYFQQFGQDSPQAARATLLKLLVPDWRVFFALLGVILVLRQLRKTTPGREPASHQQPSTDIPRAA